jgi:hypothetical protein
MRKEKKEIKQAQIKRKINLKQIRKKEKEIKQVEQNHIKNKKHRDKQVEQSHIKDNQELSFLNIEIKQAER